MKQGNYNDPITKVETTITGQTHLLGYFKWQRIFEEMAETLFQTEMEGKKAPKNKRRRKNKDLISQ